LLPARTEPVHLKGSPIGRLAELVAITELLDAFGRGADATWARLLRGRVQVLVRVSRWRCR